MTSNQFPTPWRKSSRSGGGGGAQCVEARCTSAEAREIRDSKAPGVGTIAVPGAAWRMFLGEIDRV